MQGRLPEVQRVLDGWEADYPTDPEPHVKRGRIAEHDLNSEQAEQEYREALMKSPNYPPALYALGRLLLERKRPAEAWPLFQQCAAVAPSSAAAADVGAARCLRLLGRPEEARPLLERALAMSDADRLDALREVRDQPEGDPAAFELGQLEAAAKNDQAAEKWLRQAVAKAPRDLEARYALAVVLRRLGQQDEAQAEFDHVTRIRKVMAEIDELHDKLGQDRDNAEIRYQMGIRYLQHHSQRAGVYWLQSALACDPQFAPAHRALADYYASQGTQSPAMAELAEHHRQLAEAATSEKP
jgi:Tfp pilus assembly protein PilF